MNKKILELVKELQIDCMLLEGNCLGGIYKNEDGCSRVDVCMTLFSNNFRPCEHSLEELYNIVMEEQEG